MQSERALVRSLLVVLLLTLAIVYATVLYQRKGHKTEESVTQTEPSSKITINVKTDENKKTINNKTNAVVPSQSIKQITLESSEPQNDKITTEDKSPTTNALNPEDNNQNIEKPTIKILPETSIYIGGLASLQKLWLIYEYILKDDKWIYYTRLSNKQDLATLARSYNGNIVEIVSDADLQKNQLFGDMITFINIPQYANNIVLMVVDIQDERRLIQIDYLKYHENKEYIRQRFNQ